MYIEELIQFVTGSGPWLFKHNTFFEGKDATILASFADQIAYGTNQLTEKQGLLALRVLNSHRDQIRAKLSTIDDVLDNPQWKKPFRVISQQKRISIIRQPIEGYSGPVIGIEFPYNDQLVDMLRKHNSDMHPLYKGTWNGDHKKWLFNLTEKNIEWVGVTFLAHGFQADEEFLNLYKSVSDIFEDIETHLPMLVQTDTGFKITNGHKNVPQPDTNNLVEALFWAREYGITTWDDAIETRIQNESHPVIRLILSLPKSNNKHPWVDSAVHSVDAFTDLLTYGGPALVVVPGGSELTMVRQWAEFAQRLGISKQDMSVMFRLPNDHSDFNQYVKEQELNGPITDTTRVVFVSTKITKPLIKSGIKFNTVINLGYYNYMHFTMSTVVDNARNLVYYSTKAPTIQRTWRQHEL